MKNHFPPGPYPVPASPCQFLSPQWWWLTLSPDKSAPLAYISGTLRVLIGADLLHLKEIPKLGAPNASIGGAGTFDRVFITGIVAALLV